MRIKIVTGYEIKYFDCRRPVQSPIYDYIEVDRNKMMKGICRDKLKELKEKKRKLEYLLLKSKSSINPIRYYYEYLKEEFSYPNEWPYQYKALQYNKNTWHDLIKKIDRDIRRFSPKRHKNKQKNFLRAEDLKNKMTARQIFEHYLIPINRSGFIQCISPDHSDNTPSGKVYEYNVKCFGCQKNMDTISIVQVLEPCDFKTALQIINKL